MRWISVTVNTTVQAEDLVSSAVLACGVTGVQIQPIAGNLTDNFDPRSNVIHLSQGVMNSTSAALFRDPFSEIVMMYFSCWIVICY